MCELKVVFRGNVIMEDVVSLFSDQNSVKLKSILGDVKTVSGRIKEVDLTKKQAIVE